ncbi:MAG: hypothetical protein NVSMB29_04730 [Candidatus Dormibacteria bacterium]
MEVSGSPVFVRQAIDDLPDLLARLRGERKGSAGLTSAQHPAARSIAMPPPSPHPSAEANAAPLTNGAVATNGAGADSAAVSPVVVAATSTAKNPRAKRHAAAHSLEEQVIGILAGQKRPVTVAAIRKRLNDEVSGQLVRRTLERSDRVTATTDRPAAYRLR